MLLYSYASYHVSLILEYTVKVTKAKHAVYNMVQVFLMRSSDIPYLNMSGSDLSPSRSHVFHVQFPITWKAADIRLLFSPVTNSIFISWINDTQCFVALTDKNQVIFGLL